jgi:transposase
LSEQRKYRQFTIEQQAKIVLAGLRGDRSVRNVCREYQIAETLCYQWREQLLDSGKQALANPREKTAEQAELDRLKRRVGQLERALGRKTWRWRGNSRGTESEGARRPVPRRGRCRLPRPCSRSCWTTSQPSGCPPAAGAAGPSRFTATKPLTIAAAGRI